MQLAKISLIALALAVSTAGMAQGKKSKNERVATVQVDTLSSQELSYALGMAHAKGLSDYLEKQLGVTKDDLASFMKGFDIDPNSQEAKAAQAMAAGIQIRKQVEQQMLPQVKSSINPTELVTSTFYEAFKAGAQQDEQVMSADSAEVLVNREMERRTRLANDSLFKKEEDFLRANAKKKGVKTTASGLQYKVVEKGNGAIPKSTDKVKVHYEGRLLNGHIFDSSYQRNQPATFGCNQVIKGWTEALTLMPVGAKWEVCIPQELGYGSKGAGANIPPYSTLLFTIELLEIVE